MAIESARRWKSNAEGLTQPTGIVCIDGPYVSSLRRAGIPVPGRMSVVGIDDHEMASVVDLTTVAQPVREQGAMAARLLVEMLDGRSSVGASDVVLETRLVVRGSTGVPFGSSSQAG